MDTRLLRVLVELERRGTLRAVAAATGYGTSAVSQQLAALEREAGLELVEPAGRGVRLTPAGRRLAEHGRRILAAVEEARAALNPRAEPSGVLRIAAHAEAISRDLLPVARRLTHSHPALRPQLHEHEPDEVMALLDDGLIDLGFVYDYNLVPWTCTGPSLLLSETPLVLAVPGGGHLLAAVESPAALTAYARTSWVLNSRGQTDDELVARVCALAGFTPVVAHRADSLQLILDIVAAELGIAMVPDFMSEREGVAFVPLPGIDVRRRMYAVTRPGGWEWPGVRLVTDLVAEHVSGKPHAVTSHPA